MLSAPAHQIVLVVNVIYLLENLKLGDAVAKNAYEFTFRITLPLFLLHSGPASGEIVPVGDGALVALARLVESTAAAPSLSPRGRQRAARPEAEPKPIRNCCLDSGAKNPAISSRIFPIKLKNSSRSLEERAITTKRSQKGFFANREILFAIS